MTASRSAAISLTALLALAACGGGGSHAGPPTTPVATKNAASQTAPVTLTFIIPKTDPSAKNRAVQSTGRQPRWITAATKAITVSLTAVGDPVTHNPVTPPGGLPQTTTFTVTATNQNPATPGQCGTDPTNASNVQCTEQLSLPVGFDSLTISTFDGPPGGGGTNVISQQRVVASVQQGANTFSYTLDANAGTFTVTPPGANVALSSGCPGSTITGGGVITGSSDVSGSCTATISGGGAANFTVAVADAHGTNIPVTAPGAPVLSATSSNNANFTVAVSGSTLTVTPHTANGSAKVTVTATPPNTSGASPGDGLSPIVLAFTARAIPPVSFKTRTATGLPRQFGAAGVVNNILVLAGGLTKPAATFVDAGSTQAYDPGTTAWTTRANMNVPRYKSAGAELQGFLWVSGGLDAGANVSGALEQYDADPLTNAWSSFHNLITARQRHGMATLGITMCAFGGIDTTGAVLGATECYNSDTDTWTAVSNMPTARANVAVAVLNGFFYVVGGSTASAPATSVVERYDFANDAWTTVAPFPLALQYQHAAAINGQLYVTGGSNGVGAPTTNVTYSYDPVSNSWTIGPAMPIASNLSETSAPGNNLLYLVNLGASFDQLIELSSP